MSTSCDTSKKTRLYDFSHRHGNFSLTKVSHFTHVECYKAPRLPRKTTWAHLVTRRKRHVCTTFPIGTATFTFTASKATFSYTSFLLDLLQNRRSVRGFRRFSWHVTKCHACHGIFTSALTMRFAKHTQHDTSKVLRLPRKMTSEVSKVLRLPRKMQNIVSKRGKSIALATHKTTFDTSWNMLERHEVPRLPRKTTRPHLLTRQKSYVLATFPIGTATLRPRRPQTDGCKRLRTVANGCGRQKQGQANTGQPPDPQM